MNFFDVLKGAVKSKTMWASVGTILLGTLAPPVNLWIATNPGIASTAVGILFGFLRMTTTQSLTTKGTGSPSPPVSS